MDRVGSRWKRAALLVGAATLFGTGEAAATPYTGQWDTAYGGIFPSLGWRASATFDVPNACLTLGNANNVSVGVGPCAGFALLAAQIQLYDVADPAVALGTYSLNANVVVTGIDIAGGALAGVNTGFFNAFVPSLAIAGGGNYAFSLLFYDGTLAQLAYARPIGTSPVCAFLPVPGTSCGLSANPAQAVFTADVSSLVPEPSVWALMILGFGAVGGAMRRRAVVRTSVAYAYPTGAVRAD